MHYTSFKTELIKKHTGQTRARVTKISTPHGTIMTPAFMPVGTRAFVNFMTPHDLQETGSQIILGGNTYHMLCAPGLEMIEQLGGMHRLMGWQQPMLTDSGGFQVFSLAKKGNLCKIDAKGAHFKHPSHGKIVHLTPQTSIHAQKVIGADIIMAFDECTPELGGRPAALAALERTHRWLQESVAYHAAQPHSVYGHRQALFGIIQGGRFLDLREQSTHMILAANVDGIAIGGEMIGFDMPKTLEVLRHIVPMLPDDKTRYTMGVGLQPSDLIETVAHGIDIFDCVAPTRNARHGTLYCGKIQKTADWLAFEKVEGSHKIAIKKACYAQDERPIMGDCLCYTCQHFTRAYLHYLFKQQSMAYCQLACIHNIQVMQDVCAAMRELILTS